MKKLLLFSAIVIGFISSAQEKMNTDSIINLCIEEINQDSLTKHISDLEQFETRFMLAPNRKEIANWIKNKFISMGYENTVIDSFLTETHCHYGNGNWDTTTWQYNVIAELRGSQYPEKATIVGAHYDSYNNNTSPFTSAPGADDDGSGVGAIIETARIFQKINFTPKTTIKFIAFAAEELVFFSSYSGSKHYAENAKQNNEEINFYINLDMIGNSTSNSEQKLYIYVYDNSTEVSNYAVSCCKTYSTLIPNPTKITFGGVDSHWFFINGYKTVYFEEFEFSPNYHTSTDIVNNCNMDYCAEVTKISSAMLIGSSNSITGIKKDAEPKIKLKIYPNPTSGVFVVESNDIIKIEVTDMKGKLMLSTNGADIDISNQPNGIYFVRAISGKQSITQRIIKH